MVENCPQIYSSRLESILKTVHQTIDKTIAELRVRIIRHDNEERRKASFKNYQYLPFLLERLYDVSRLKTLDGLKPDRDILQQPHIACLSPESAQKYAWLNLGFDPWVWCRTAPYPQIRLAPYTAYMFVCPQFFSASPEGITNRCPDVINNRFVGNEDEYYLDSQLYQIIIQLYALYLRGRAIDWARPDWNECILDLDPRESVLQPKNVALWTFCKKSSAVDNTKKCRTLTDFRSRQ